MSVIEHMFAPTTQTGETAERFDFRDRVDALRCRSTKDLRRLVADARREQQRWHLEELAAIRVLDDRDALGALPDATISARTAKTDRDVARALESLPAVAKAAHDGCLSWDQLAPLTQVATPASDAEWAARGPNVAPVDLQRMARQARTVTAEDAAARRAARAVFTWREAETGMCAGRWSLPDVDGVLVDKVLGHMAERMRPPQGLAWDSLAHRKADALVELARTYADTERTGRFRVEIVQITDHRGEVSSEVEGIPLADATVDAHRPAAKVREAVRDATGTHTTRGLQIHHTDPICHHGDSHDPRKLAGVCPSHHQLLEPHGPYRLSGNAEDLHGLRLTHRDDQPPDDRARDGPAH